MAMAKENKPMDLTPVLYLGTAAILYFGIIKPITNTLGLTRSVDDQQKLDENKAASTASGWNPNFYKNYTGSKRLFYDADVAKLAKQIYDAWGIINDDENAIYGVFRQVSTQLQLSQLCDKYFQLYTTDLLSRLHNPWYKSNDGLSDEEFNVIAKIVNALPVNK